MEKIWTALFIKPGIGIKDLEKYGFRGTDWYAYWKPHFTCAKFEKIYYSDQTDYTVKVIPNGQIVIYPNGWTQLSGKIQCLLYDMITDGIVEKRTITEQTKYTIIIWKDQKEIDFFETTDKQRAIDWIKEKGYRQQEVGVEIDVDGKMIDPITEEELGF